MMEHIKKENLESADADDELVDEIFGPVRIDHQGDEELTEPIGSDEDMEAGENEGEKTVGSSFPVSYAMPPAGSGMLPVTGVMRIGQRLFHGLHACQAWFRSLPGGRLCSLEQGVTSVTLVPTHGLRLAPVPCGQGVAPASFGSALSTVVTSATREGGSR